MHPDTGSGSATDTFDSLLTFLRPDCGTDGIEPSALTVDSPQLADLMGLSAEQGVLPTVYQATAAGKTTVIAPALSSAYRANCVRNTILSHELFEILSALAAQGIRAVPFKGPTLAARVYGSIHDRQFSDLDILIALDDLEAAATVLAKRGYRQQRLPTALTEFIRYHHQVGYVRAQDGVFVELQWGFAPKWFAFPLRTAEVLASAYPMPFLTGDVLQPTPTHLLLILAGHGTKHCWSKLAWILDFDRFMGSEGQHLNWRETLDDARRRGAERMLLLSSALCQTLIDTELPESVQRRLDDDKAVKSLARLAARNLRTSAHRPSAEVGPWGVLRQRERLRLHLQSRERWRDRIPLMLWTAKRQLKWRTRFLRHGHIAH